jgi:hypothetical protein
MQNNVPPYMAIIERMHREQINANELSMVPDKIRDEYQDQLNAQAQQIATLQNGMLQICQLLEAKQNAPFVATSVVRAPAAKASVPAMNTAIPKIQKQVVPVKSVLSVNGTESPEVYYRFAITELRKQNKPYGKSSKVSKGVHAVYGGLNSALKKQYGEDTDVVALTNQMAEKGIIAMKMVHGGPMVYLPEDFTITDDTNVITL